MSASVIHQKGQATCGRNLPRRDAGQSTPAEGRARPLALTRPTVSAAIIQPDVGEAAPTLAELAGDVVSALAALLRRGAAVNGVRSRRRYAVAELNAAALGRCTFFST